MIDNNISSGKVENSTVLGKFCTINICGLSQRSNMMLSKYASDNDILLFGVQETGSSSQWKSLTNMKTFEDTFSRIGSVELVNAKSIDVAHSMWS